jgi:regulator of RNase E activity RraA
MSNARPFGSSGAPILKEADFPRVPEELLDEIRALAGAATTGSDVLDELGLSLAVPADALRPRVTRVVTAAFGPERRALSYPGLREEPSALMHDRLFAVAKPGDIVAFDARGSDAISLLGGLAAAQAKKLGISACLIDGGVRDLNEIEDIGLPVWSRSLTPRTGRWRIQLLTLNFPIVCGGVQVHAGDVAVADETGVCFFPNALAEQGLRRLLEIADHERAQLKT